jgi:hypothetical protein
MLGTMMLASGETFTVPLPELLGVYGPGSSRTASFDLGTSFRAIQKVRIHWSGTLTPGLGHGDGIERPADEWFAWPAKFGALMDPPGPSEWWAWVGPSSPFDVEQAFAPRWGATWDSLLDGRGEVTVRLFSAIVIGGVMVTPPSGWIGEAHLVLEGDALRRGDLNCDGAVDLDDIDPFVTALVSRAVYESRYVGCSWFNGDIDGDGDVSFEDISPFVRCLSNGACR